MISAGEGSNLEFKSTLRTNLHNAVIQVHNAGYVLRNHPHLTHSEAKLLGDEDAV